MTHVSAEEWFPIGAPGIVRPRVGGRAMGSPPRGGPGNGSAPTWRAGQWFAPHVGGRGKMPPPPRGGPGNDSPHVGVRGNASARTWGSVWECLRPYVEVRENAFATRGTTSGEEHLLRWCGGDHLPACDLRLQLVQLLRTQLTALCPDGLSFFEN